MKTGRLLATAAFLVTIAGCASALRAFPPDDVARPAVDTPARFEGPVTASGSGAPGATTSPVTCQSPLTDPRNGAKLRFVRTQPGRGDYEVADGQYGARPGELLRIDCSTLQAVGLVPR